MLDLRKFLGSDAARLGRRNITARNYLKINDMAGS